MRKISLSCEDTILRLPIDSDNKSSETILLQQKCLLAFKSNVLQEATFVYDNIQYSEKDFVSKKLYLVPILCNGLYLYAEKYT